MRAFAPAVLCLLVALAGTAAGCREEGPTPARSDIAPPTWNVARDEAEPGRLLIDVRAPAPCRVRVRFEGVAEKAMAETVRTFVAGETARLTVRTQLDGKPQSNAAVATADLAAGRTEAWFASLGASWDDGPSAQRREVVGARPGKGRALDIWLAIPPRQAQPLHFGQDLDLTCAAIVDGGVDVALEGREGGSRLRGKLDAAQGDRATLLRVVLRAERIAP